MKVIGSDTQGGLAPSLPGARLAAAVARRAPAGWAWLPMALTVLRILLIPVFLWAAHACTQSIGSLDRARWTALCVLFLIGLSDLLDGWLARRWGIVTELGATLDAGADKLAQVACLAFFLGDHEPTFVRVPLAFFGWIIARDLILCTGYLVLRRRAGDVDNQHRWHGRVSSGLLFLLVTLVTAGASAAWLQFLFVVSAAVVALSTASYVVAGWRTWLALQRTS
jgi:phosphatidylglycerophosphate synthase